MRSHARRALLLVAAMVAAGCSAKSDAGGDAKTTASVPSSNCRFAYDPKHPIVGCWAHPKIAYDPESETSKYTAAGDKAVAKQFYDSAYASATYDPSADHFVSVTFAPDGTFEGVEEVGDSKTGRTAGRYVVSSEKVAIGYNKFVTRPNSAITLNYSSGTYAGHRLPESINFGAGAKNINLYIRGASIIPSVGRMQRE